MVILVWDYLLCFRSEPGCLQTLQATPPSFSNLSTGAPEGIQPFSRWILLLILVLLQSPSFGSEPFARLRFCKDIKFHKYLTVFENRPKHFQDINVQFMYFRANLKLNFEQILTFVTEQHFTCQIFHKQFSKVISK